MCKAKRGYTRAQLRARDRVLLAADALCEAAGIDFAEDPDLYMETKWALLNAIKDALPSLSAAYDKMCGDQ